MEFLGVLGEKLPHTYSPIINKRIMELINVEGAYKKFELPQGNMHKFIDGVKTLDIRGFNITIPYKEEVIPFLDYISDEVLEEIVDLGMDGVERFSNDIHEQTIAAALKIVRKRKLFVSCGSDYHGPTKPKYHMGVSNCPEKALPLVRILTKAAK